MAKAKREPRDEPPVPATVRPAYEAIVGLTDMKLTAIDNAFGVAESTGQGKSKTNRSMLKIRQFDHRWALPSRWGDTSMIWTLEVNDFIMDIRGCPREAQEVAFEKGLIPYIPADRPAGVKGDKQ